MALNLQKVKNSGKDGNRPIHEYQEDLEVALATFEQETGVLLDPFVRRTLGARDFTLNSKKDRSYTHPFPFIASYGRYVFSCVSVPADIDDGKSDFTNLYVVATRTHLVAIFNDPHWVYNSFFGGAVLKLLASYEEKETADIPELVFNILGFAVASLDHALDALSNRHERFAKKIKSVDKDDGLALEQEVDHRLPALESLQIETSSLGSVVIETARVVAKVAAGAVETDELGGSRDYFSDESKAALGGLQIHSAHLEVFHKSLLYDVEALIALLDRYQEKSLTIATHRVTAFGALILVPNLLFDYFGQSFNPLPDWFRHYGYVATFAAMIIYWVLHGLWFRRRRYL